MFNLRQLAGVAPVGDAAGDDGGLHLASQGKHTPFLGYELAGQVQATIVAGRVAYRRNAR